MSILERRRGENKVTLRLKKGERMGTTGRLIALLTINHTSHNLMYHCLMKAIVFTLKGETRYTLRRVLVVFFNIHHSLVVNH